MTVIAYRVARSFGLTLGGAAAVFAASTASAAPVVDFAISVNGGSGGPFATAFSQAGVTPVGQVYSYVGSLADSNGEWNLSWNFTADEDPVGGAKIGSGFTFENKMGDVPGQGNNHLQVSIYVSLDVFASLDPTTFIGNTGLTLGITESANGNFGEVTTTGGNAMWNGLINNADAVSLFPNGSAFGGSNGPATVDSGPEFLSPAQLASLANQNPSNIGIRLDFDLTPGETVGFVGVFGFIPAPGALALLGLAGLAGSSRRRRI